MEQAYENKVREKPRLMKILVNKKAVALALLFWLILGVVVLVIVVFIIMILIGKGGAAIEFIKDLFRVSLVGVFS